MTIIGTVHDKTCISFKPLENRACCVCHQRKSQTFAIEPFEKLPCNLFNCQMTKHLSPHQFMSFTSLRMVAPLLFVPSTGDSNIYYCIGTAYVLRENEPTKVKMHFPFLLYENLRWLILLLSHLGFLVFYLLTTAGKDVGFHC